MKDLLDFAIQKDNDDIEKSAAQIANEKVYKSRYMQAELQKKLSVSKTDLPNAYKNVLKRINTKTEIGLYERRMLDNFYLFEQQIKYLVFALTKKQIRLLPKMTSGQYRGLPRIFAVVNEMLFLYNCKIDQEAIIGYISFLQEKTTLEMEELDVLKSMIALRLVNISTSVAKQEEKEHADIQAADKWVKTLKGIVAKNALEKAIKRLVNEQTHSGAFINEMHKQLSQSSKAEIYEQYEMMLLKKGIDVKKIISETKTNNKKRESIFYACIESIRGLMSIPFDEVYEALCLVEAELKKDEIYTQMDDTSRQYYRRRIELFSRKINISEIEIAKKAVELAGAEIGAGGHVGYYIMDNGQNMLAKQLGKRYRSKSVKERFYLYKNTLVVSWAILLLLSAYYLYSNSHDVFRTLVISAFMSLPFYAICQRILNDFVLRLNKPAFMPKIKLEKLGKKHRTIVISPRVITDKDVIDEAVRDLETYYIANKDDNIFFVLLGDFADAEEAIYPKDIELIEYTDLRFKELNKKYSRKESAFYYLQRSRGYSQTQGHFIAPERKRGSVESFNELLLGREGAKEKYKYLTQELPKDIVYVITLDSDTKLILGSAKRLVGAIIHPLNRPVVSDGKIVRGYGIIQPRISTNVYSAGKSRFSNIFCGQTGLDVYSSAVSDVYMDLFGEGIFTGKGLYDVKAFTAATKDKFEKEQILSHDLIEGIFAKVGYASDVQLSDGFPASYISFMKRQHRWVRGDWQLLPFLKKESIKELGIDAFSAFKIKDNLFRSLLPFCVLMILLIGLFSRPEISVFIVLVSLLSLFINVILDFFTAFYVYTTSSGLMANAKDMLYECKNALLQSLLNIIFLPFYAWTNFSAIMRTLFRITFTRKNMLEWNTFASVERSQKNGIANFYIEMITAPLLGAFVLLCTYFLHSRVSVPYLILGISWLIAPAAAYAVSKNINYDEYALSDENKKFVRAFARKTWAYFEDYLNTENNFLIPDNYQYIPNKNIAQRTSPTNIGLSLASIIAANDLGYLDFINALKKTEAVIVTIEKMKKWNGHLYNWYDTNTLKPLHPFFISSVDSGNLASYMALCSQAIKQKLDMQLIGREQIEGMIDTLELIERKDNKIKALIQICDMLRKELKNGLAAQSMADYQSLMGLIMESKTKDEWAKKARIMAEGYYNYIQSITSYIEPLIELRNIVKDIELCRDVIEKIEELTVDNLSVSGLIKIYPKIMEQISVMTSADIETNEHIKNKLEQVQSSIEKSRKELKIIQTTAFDLCAKIDALFNDMDFGCVYDKSKELFAIGYNLEEGKLSGSSYDMLASEARQTSFLAIAKGDVDPKHWFRFARPLAMAGTGRMLVSWGGTMFEYFMPLLTMRTARNTILGETYSSIIDAHIAYGKAKNVPWGVSESGFYKFDSNMYYQYKAFGLPKTGLKSGLGNDTVIAPYATCMALMVKPNAAIKNMKALEKSGASGRYGFYEAIDYTKTRLYGGKQSLIVKSFMAHHLGMSLLAFDNVLNNDVVQDYFHSIPQIRAIESLLDESIPARNIIMSEFEQNTQEKTVEIEDITISRAFEAKREMEPHVHYISNGEYKIYLNSFGGGQSTYNGYAINRFRGDAFSDTKGIFFYLKNVKTKDTWSLTVSPIGSITPGCNIKYDEDKAIYTRTDYNIKTSTEVCICAARNAEIRRLTITNNNDAEVELELTSFFEVSMSPVDDDWSHAQFYNLFIESYYDKKSDALIFKRRRRAEKEKPVFLYNKLIASGETSYESDRAEFIGRGNDISDPVAIGNQLKNSYGIVIDPCSALRKRIKIGANKSTTLYFVLGMEKEEEEALRAAAITKKIAEEEIAAFKAESIIKLSHTGMTKKMLEFATKLQDQVLQEACKKDKLELIKNNVKPKSALWRYGISANNAIVLCYAKGLEQLDNVLEIIKAAAYFSLHGAPIDIVIINKEENGYYQPLRDKLNDEISLRANRLIHIINAIDINDDDRVLLEAVCSIKFDCKYPLSEQLNEANTQNTANEPELISPISNEMNKNTPQKELEYTFYNGFGGFLNDGSQYAIKIENGKVPLLPYCNIISNPQFGIVACDEGICFSYAENSRENKLTRFENDAIESNVSQAVYVRDNETLAYNTVSRAPVKRDASYRTVHAKGYSVYECSYNGLIEEQKVHVDADKKLSYINVKIKNVSEKTRKLSVYYYADILLGVDARSKKKLLYTGYDNGILYAKNTETAEFTGLAYAACPGHEISFTGKKECFIGKGRSIKNPKAMHFDSLDNDIGAEDCCIAIKTDMTIESGESKDVMFIFGYEHTLFRAEKTIEGIVPNKSAEVSLEKTKDFWDEFCGKIKIKTPDESFNILVNEWLPYQMLSSRVWGRTGFYQVGGATGFRDQLQDMLSVMLLDEEIARKHIISCAAHQFEDGDVQHWWHQPAVGVRTHIKDDLLFLPYVLSEYIQKTGDATILNETAHYLENVYLDSLKEDVYVDAKVSEKSATIHEHCLKAIEKAMSFGEHGLPLIGRGDWNDGMNNIGTKGRGESVWLGFFMYDVLKRYISILELMDDKKTIIGYEKTMRELKKALNSEGWDGSWFRRAYFDDGTALGSVYNDECKIDCVSQAFSVISGAGDALKCESAMEAVYKMLVDKENGIIKLLWPAFDKSSMEPGYIKGYNPGIRENGGQYTHGAIWAVIAFAKLKQNERAYELFSMLNPINHSKTEMEARKYKGEPYAIAADVYDAAGLKGRSGWTWYTGSASWLYKTAVEEIIGLKKQGDRLIIDSCLPKAFNEVKIEYKYKDTIYRITIESDKEAGKNKNDRIIDLINDKEVHDVIVRI